MPSLRSRENQFEETIDTEAENHSEYNADDRRFDLQRGHGPDGPGPKTEKTYGIGLPRDHASQLFADKDYPVFPLKPGQEAYKDIDGARMKKDVIALSQIALRYRDTVNKQWWGRFPGTDADKEGMEYMTDEFERLGLKVESFPYVLPRDWRPQSWNASYKTANGNKIDLATAFPVSGTKATAPAASPPRPSGSASAPKPISSAATSRARPSSSTARSCLAAAAIRPATAPACSMPTRGRRNSAPPWSST